MLEKLLAAHAAGKLQFFGSHAALTERKAFAAYLAPLRRRKWHVYCKAPFAGPEAVLAYSRARAAAREEVRARWAAEDAPLSISRGAAVNWSPTWPSWPRRPHWTAARQRSRPEAKNSSKQLGIRAPHKQSLTSRTLVNDFSRSYSYNSRRN